MEVESRPYSSTELNLSEGAFIESLKAGSQNALPDPDQWLEEELRRNIIVTTIDALIHWGRRYSTWPVNFGLACCAFEQISTAASRFDIARFGMELFRASPRQADLLLVSGTLTWRAGPARFRCVTARPCCSGTARVDASRPTWSSTCSCRRSAATPRPSRTPPSSTSTVRASR